MCVEILAFAARVPVLQHQVHDAGISQRHVAIERRRSAGADRDRVLHAGGLQADARDLIHHLLGALQRRAVGHLHGDHEIALVLRSG